MVFSPLHFVPSAIAAALAAYIAFGKPRGGHKQLAFAMLFFALLGLAGYALAGFEDLFPIDFHSAHAWIGFAAVALSLTPFLFRNSIITNGRLHCLLGRTAGVLALVALALGLILLLGLLPQGTATASPYLQVAVSSTLPEHEASEFQGAQLTPLSEQQNNAIQGTQFIDRNSYRLTVTGLVRQNLSLSYDDLLAFPAYSEVAYMPCVEGWGFNAKWTGFRISDLLARAGLQEEAAYVVFNSSDGYSSALPLSYVNGQQILLAYGINDVTLPAERGFPLQVVAKSKYGYKWAKWIVGIEVVGVETRGYWESLGYSDVADVGSFPFG